MLCGYLCAVLHHCITFVAEVKYFCLVHDSYIDPFLPVTEDFACPLCLVKCGSYKVKFDAKFHLRCIYSNLTLLLLAGGSFHLLQLGKTKYFILTAPLMSRCSLWWNLDCVCFLHDLSIFWGTIFVPTWKEAGAVPGGVWPFHFPICNMYLHNWQFSYSIDNITWMIAYTCILITVSAD